MANSTGKRRGALWKALLWCALAVMLAGAACGAAFLLYGRANWGRFDAAKLSEYSQSTFIYDRNGKRAASVHSSENRTNIELETLPSHVTDAFLAAEDLRFYKHHGFDAIRIFGAIVNDIKTGDFSQGASTITQQLVKLTHLSAEKKLSRKLKEVYYSIQVEREYEKDEILEMYLNYVYFGNGAYGIEAAAQKYFGIGAAELSVAQAASLAAVLKSPSAYAPHIDMEANTSRRRMIIKTMYENEMISALDASLALETTLTLVDNADSLAAGRWFTDTATDEACALLGVSLQELMSGGYRIYTALDPEMQAVLEQTAANDALMPPDSADGQRAQCAMILMARDGAVRALVGGREYSTAYGLDRASDSRRQPGSVLKPLAVYAPAIETLGVTTVSLFNDEATDFGGYAPSNYGGYYYGRVSLRTACEKSLNIPAVTMMRDMGADAARGYLQRFGVSIDGSDRYLSLALGSMTYGTTPRELCGAYLAFINGGSRPEAYLIEHIEDSTGRTLWTRSARSTSVMTASTAAIVTDMLRTTAQNGTARRLAALGWDVGAKTGTVDYEGVGNRDAWCAALTPEHALVVWMGFDTTDPDTYLPSSVTGGANPTMAALAVLEAAFPGGEGSFSEPATVVRLGVDKKTLEEEGIAVLATPLTPAQYCLWEIFDLNNRPREVSEYWQTPSAPGDVRVGAERIGFPIVSFTSGGEHIRYRVFRAIYGRPETLEQIGAAEGIAQGETASVADVSAGWMILYEYTVVAEHTLAAEYGMEGAASLPSAPVTYRTTLFSFPNALRSG